MIETNHNFIDPLARRFFPKTTSENVTNAVKQNLNRTEGIRQEIRFIPNFPENLVEPTANIVSFLEIALDKTIKPYDGGAISVLDWDSPHVLTGIGEDIRGGINNFVVITENQMIGRFVFKDETLVIDYKNGSETPDVVSHNQKVSADGDIIERLIKIDTPKIAVVRI